MKLCSTVTQKCMCLSLFPFIRSSQSESASSLAMICAVRIVLVPSAYLTVKFSTKAIQTPTDISVTGCIGTAHLTFFLYMYSVWHMLMYTPSYVLGFLIESLSNCNLRFEVLYVEGCSPNLARIILLQFSHAMAEGCLDLEQLSRVPTPNSVLTVDPEKGEGTGARRNNWLYSYWGTVWC